MAPSGLLRRLDRHTPAIAALAALMALTALFLRSPTPAAPWRRSVPPPPNSRARGGSAAAAAAAAPPSGGVLTRPASMAPPPGTRLVYIDAGFEGGRAGDWFWSTPPPLFGARAHVTSPSPADYDAYVFSTDAGVVANVTARQSAGARVTVVEAEAAATDAPAVPAGPGGRPARPARVDFAAWLGRTFAPTDYLLCRLDLEGGETAVVRRLLRAGLLCRCARLSIEWHMWVGTRDAPHGVHFNHPPAVGEDGNVFAIDGAAAQGGVTCTIPHLGKALPFTECMLPKVLSWARRDCPPPAAPMERWV